jgi:hypothetical protein
MSVVYLYPAMIGVRVRCDCQAQGRPHKNRGVGIGIPRFVQRLRVCRTMRKPTTTNDNQLLQQYSKDLYISFDIFFCLIVFSRLLHLFKKLAPFVLLLYFFSRPLATIPQTNSNTSTGISQHGSSRRTTCSYRSDR